MLRVIVIDDEEGAREGLSNMLLRFVSGVEVVGKAANARDAFKKIQSEKPDAVFLDVEMPLENGFQLLSRFPKVDFQVIFVTAYQHFALKAIKFSALDYLLKPVDIDELENTIRRLKTKKESEEVLQRKLATLHENLNKPTNNKSIALPNNHSVLFVPLEDIVRCESDANYTLFFLKSGKKMIVAKTLGDYENELFGEGFYRVHRSHLINLKHITRVEKQQGGVVQMSDGSKVEVSRRKKQGFLAAIGLKEADYL